MALAYRDFIPEVAKKTIFSITFESFSTAVDEANAWIATDQVQVINVETVLLPNLSEQGQVSSSHLMDGGEHSAYWRQIVRVWYRQ